MTTTAHTQTPTQADFDAWTDDDERKAIDETAKALAVRHVLKGGWYYGLLPGGHVYRLPLNLSIHDFDRLSTVASDAESLDAVKGIIRAFAPDKADELEDEPIVSVMNLLADYGRIIGRMQGADLGKSSPSAES